MHRSPQVPGPQTSSGTSTGARADGRRPGRLGAARGVDAPPSPSSLQSPRARPARGGAASSPAFPLPKPSPEEPRRRLPEAPALCSTLGSARAPRPAPGMEPDSSSSLSAGPRTRDPESTAPRRGRRRPHQAPTSLGSDQTWPRLPGREMGGTAVERGSTNPAWRNRTRTSGREWGPVEMGRRGERKPQKIPKPVALPHGGTVPPPLPARDQLPSCSQRKNPSRSCNSAGTGRPVRAPPARARHSAAPRTSLPCTAPPGARSPRGLVPLQPQPPGRRTRLLPPLGFKLKFPGWGRQRTRRSSPAPSRRKPLLRPRRTRPQRGNPRGPHHAPPSQATPPGRAFPRDWPPRSPGTQSWKDASGGWSCPG